MLHIVNKIRPVFSTYRYRIFCSLVGLFAGFFGFVLGLLTGFFIDMLIQRSRDEKKLMKYFEQPSNKEYVASEVFEGAIQICSLAVYLTGNPTIAASQIRRSFTDYLDCDWETLCRSAFNAKISNMDLVTECLALKISRCTDTNMVSNVFGFLESIEFGWDDRNGNRPSEYLSELLQVTGTKTNRASAYRILGVHEEDNLAIIKSAHRRLIAQYHPDTLKSLSPDQQKIASNAFHRIQKAYELIMNLRKDV